MASKISRELSKYLPPLSFPKLKTCSDLSNFSSILAFLGLGIILWGPFGGFLLGAAAWARHYQVLNRERNGTVEKGERAAKEVFSKPDFSRSIEEEFEILKRLNFLLDKSDLDRPNDYRTAWLDRKEIDFCIEELLNQKKDPSIRYISFRTERKNSSLAEQIEIGLNRLESTGFQLNPNERHLYLLTDPELLHWIVVELNWKENSIGYYNSFGTTEQNKLQIREVQQMLQQKYPLSKPLNFDFYLKINRQADGYQCGCWAYWFMKQLILERSLFDGTAQTAQTVRLELFTHLLNLFQTKLKRCEEFLADPKSSKHPEFERWKELILGPPSSKIPSRGMKENESIYQKAVLELRRL